MNTLKNGFNLNQFATGFRRGALAALVLVTLMASCTQAASAKDPSWVEVAQPHDKLHAGDVSGSSVPVTIVCTSPVVLRDILSAPDLKSMQYLAKKAGELGYCAALASPAVVKLDAAVGFVIVGPHDGLPQVVRATIYRVARKDGDTEAKLQYYVYTTETLQES